MGSFDEVYKNKEAHRLESAGIEKNQAKKIVDRLFDVNDPALVFDAQDESAATALVEAGKEAGIDKIIFASKNKEAENILAQSEMYQNVTKLVAMNDTNLPLKNMTEIEKHSLFGIEKYASNVEKYSWHVQGPIDATDFASMFDNVNKHKIKDFKLSLEGEEAIQPDAVYEVGMFVLTLPSGIEKLDFNRLPFSDVSARNLSDYPRKLKSLGIHGVEISDKCAENLAETAAKVKLESLDLTGSSINPEARNILMQNLPSSVRSRKVPDTTANPMFQAVVAGKTQELFEGNKKLSVDDFLTEANGRNLITEMAWSGQLATVFQGKNWNSAKDMQTVWNAVPEDQKYQVDGKDGRPNFIKEKSIATANALRGHIMSNGRG